MEYLQNRQNYVALSHDPVAVLTLSQTVLIQDIANNVCVNTFSVTVNAENVLQPHFVLSQHLSKTWNTFVN